MRFVGGVCCFVLSMVVGVVVCGRGLFWFVVLSAFGCGCVLFVDWCLMCVIVACYCLVLFFCCYCYLLSLCVVVCCCVVVC